MGQAVIPIVLALAGAGVSAYNTQKTAKKQDQAAAEGIRRQSEIQREANKRLNESLLFFEKSDPESIKADLSGGFTKQLRLKQALALAGLEQEGASSQDAEKAAAQAGGTAVDYGDFLEGVFSRIDAPGEQRRQEGVERTDLGSDLSVHERNSRAQDYLTRLDIQSITRNPWLDILAAGLGGASGGLAAGGLGAGLAGGGMVLGNAGPNYGIPTTAGLGGTPPSSLYGLSRI